MQESYLDVDQRATFFQVAYRLHLPPNPPAIMLWAVTLYNVPDGTMVQTPQLLPSIDQLDRLTHNDDGSLDATSGRPGATAFPRATGSRPLRPGLHCTIRIYGDKTEFYDQTWKSDDVVKVT